jgi:hypothetical protein
MKESSYGQFSDTTLLGYIGKWPLESYDGGSHIGLMMVPLTMDDALTNTQTGVGVFYDKIQAARVLERRILRNYHGLLHLTDVEIENMSLVLYGEFGSSILDRQYYIPQVSGNTVDWVVNIANNPDGVAYADNVQNQVT